MDWSNERYIRYYSRDTVTFSTWPWEAQALLGPLMRKLDRAGVLDIGHHNPIDAVWSLYPTWPRGTIEAGLSAMMRSGTIIHEGDRLLMPNFLDAQEARQTDSQRQRESRARKRDIQSRNVTISHIESRNVTPCLTVPSRAVLTSQLGEADASPPRATRMAARQEPTLDDPPDGADVPPPHAVRVAARQAPALDDQQPGDADALPPHAVRVAARQVPTPHDPAGDADVPPPRSVAARQVPTFRPKAKAREIFADYDKIRIERLGGNVTRFTDDHYRVMQQTVRYIQQEHECDETAAWDWLERFGKAAIDEAVSPEHNAEWAGRLRRWRVGPSAWAKKRYQAVMAAVDARGVGQKANGQKRKIKHDDITGQPYFVDEWGRRQGCDEQGHLIGDEGYASG